MFKIKHEFPSIIHEFFMNDIFLHRSICTTLAPLRLLPLGKTKIFLFFLLLIRNFAP